MTHRPLGLTQAVPHTNSAHCHPGTTFFHCYDCLSAGCFYFSYSSWDHYFHDRYSPYRLGKAWCGSRLSKRSWLEMLATSRSFRTLIGYSLGTLNFFQGFITMCMIITTWNGSFMYVCEMTLIKPSHFNAASFFIPTAKISQTCVNYDYATKASSSSRSECLFV